MSSSIGWRDDNKAPVWLIPQREFGHISSHSCAQARLWNHTRRTRMHTVDIDDRIQLHDYIFSRSFKWFIGMHLDGEHICRQYSGEVAARRRYWPVRSAGQIKNNEIQHLCQVEMSAGSEGGRSRRERVEDGGAGVWCAFIKAFLIIKLLLGSLKVGFSFRVHSVKELIDFTGRWGLRRRCHALYGNIDKGGFERTIAVLCLQLSFFLIKPHWLIYQPVS